MNWDAVEERLKDEEGKRNFAYDDKTGRQLKPGDKLTGQLTIGYGHNLSANGITDRQAHDMLVDDMTFVFHDLQDALPWWQMLDEVRQAVLFDLAFNMGIKRLLKFKTTLAHLQNGRYAFAAKSLSESAYYKQVPKRAERNVRMLLTGTYAD